jgi:hypothetical protein
VIAQVAVMAIFILIGIIARLNFGRSHPPDVHASDQHMATRASSSRQRVEILSFTSECWRVERSGGFQSLGSHLSRFLFDHSMVCRAFYRVRLFRRTAPIPYLGR